VKTAPYDISCPPVAQTGNQTYEAVPSWQDGDPLSGRRSLDVNLQTGDVTVIEVTCPGHQQVYSAGKYEQLGLSKN